MSDAKRVLMVCEDEETRAEFSEMLKRISSAMSAVDSFAEKLITVDEGAPGAQEKAWPMLNRLMLTLISVYPDPRQMQQDIKSIGDFSVWSKDKNGTLTRSSQA